MRHKAWFHTPRQCLLMIVMFTASSTMLSATFVSAANNSASSALPWSSSSDHSALLEFKASLDANLKLMTWSGDDHCSGLWYGVHCDANGRVNRLVLQGLQLSGGPIEPLARLDGLRILSLDNNLLNGSLPNNLSNWRYMRSLYLSRNEFSGPIPDSISTLSRLWRLDLSRNILSGQVPSSLTQLSKLLTLKLDNNKLTGPLPNLENLVNLKDFNVSFNQLDGPIPGSLSNFSISSFQGNEGLCGVPLLVCDTSQQPTNPHGDGGKDNPMVVSSSPSSKPASTVSVIKSEKRPFKLGSGALIAIVVGDVAVVVLITSCFILYYWKKYSHVQEVHSSENADRSHNDNNNQEARKEIKKEKRKDIKEKKKMSDSEKLAFNYPSMQVEGEKGKLVFMDGRKQFELEDLLRASAEMLGKGLFGTSYKATLEDGSVVAVKRLKDPTTGGRKDFEQQMDVIGRLKHPNLVALRAYYYARDEKLLVYDYLPSGNLYSLLHGNRGPGRTPLDWTTRIKIAVGVARGLAYIHHQCKTQKLIHGNIKSTNVLLDKDGNACISDFGLILMTHSSAVLTKWLIGYRAPELNETKKVSQKGDVYSYGVLLLEILTGKPAMRSLYSHDDGVDLPKWVQSVVQEEWTAEVFDLELLRYKNVEEEMVGMLQIAMQCVSSLPKQRPRMSQVVKMVEDVIGGSHLQSPFRRYDSFDSISMSPSISEDTGTSH